MSVKFVDRTRAGSVANLGHFILGVHGLALLRHWLAGGAPAEARVEEIRGIVNQPETGPLALELDVPELDVRTGYAAWVDNYDSGPNPLIEVEEPVLRRLIDRVPVGTALDAACGTGRQACYLAARGHRTIGVDGSVHMLRQARRKVPAAEFRVGDLEALPIQSASIDLAVCTLALAHCRDLTPSVRELARVVKPTGRIIISEPHPLWSMLGAEALFVTEDQRCAYVKNHCHSHGDYLHAFARAGLEVRECEEPPLGPRESELFAAVMPGGVLEMTREAVRMALEGLPGALIWELTPAS